MSGEITNVKVDKTRKYIILANDLNCIIITDDADTGQGSDKELWKTSSPIRKSHPYSGVIHSILSIKRGVEAISLSFGQWGKAGLENVV